jgi:hypothetical protein
MFSLAVTKDIKYIRRIEEFVTQFEVYRVLILKE